MKHVNEMQYLVPGDYYLVDSISLDKTDDPQFDIRILEEEDRYVYFPILGPAHTDQIIGEYGNVLQNQLISLHYHLDQRFMTEEQIIDRVIIFVDHKHRSDPFEIINRSALREIVRPMKCIRNYFPVGVVLPNIEKRYIYKNAINNRCPHKGAYLGNLQVENNCVDARTKD